MRGRLVSRGQQGLFDAYFTAGVDVNLGTVRYGNPFPASWGTYVEVAQVWDVSIAAPGGTSVLESALSGIITTAAGISAGPIRPLVTPVTEILLDGMSTAGALSGISSVPVLSWTPPANGSPSAYVVAIVDTSASDDAIPPIIETTTTTARIPSGLLQSGHLYYFVVTAVVSSIEVSTSPFRAAPTYGFADALTSVVSPL